MENLKREVKISYSFEHANLIKCINTMESSSSYYIVFELCRGGDLKDFLKKKKKLAIKEVMSLMVQLRDCYVYLNKSDILHRDIKLENILLKEEGDLQIKLSDFGCSKVDPIGKTICGTPKYMAYELLCPSLDKTVVYDYKVDLWSIGLCFWELLFGDKQFPFSLKSKEALIKDIKYKSGKKLDFPKRVKLPEEFYDFFRKCLEISPKNRMDIHEFYSHPVFNYTGTEDVFKSGKNSIIKVKKGKFSSIHKAYKEKVLEVELINKTVEEMLGFNTKEYSNDFLT